MLDQTDVLDVKQRGGERLEREREHDEQRAENDRPVTVARGDCPHKERTTVPYQSSVEQRIRGKAHLFRV